MAIRNILTIGDETLRKKSRKVEKIDGRITTILTDMADTLHNAEDGIGLAAPQVGILKRIVVIDMGDGVMNLINPEIIEKEGSQETIESCLSIPGGYGRVVRPEKVKVTAQDEKGEHIEINGDGILAVCLCHEIDHLDGILYVDRTEKHLSGVYKNG